MLDSFLSLRIKEVSYTDPLEKKEEKKNNFDKLSKRERKVHHPLKGSTTLSHITCTIKNKYIVEKNIYPLELVRN